MPRFFTAFLWLSQKRYIFARSSTASSPAGVFTSCDEITLGFVAKKRFEDHSEESLVVISAPEDWTLTR